MLARRIAVSLTLLAALDSPASAQLLAQDIAADAVPDVGENLDALPGAFRVASALGLREGLAIGVTLGYGYTEDVLKLEDKHHRMRGAAAASYRPQPWLAAGFRLDGRYDKHSGGGIDDDGWVGDARANILLARPVSPTLGVGLQLVGWAPGGISGFSVDAKGIATLAAGPALLSANAGFRLDRSADSVDDPDALSPSDRLALGVSDSSAALVGLGVQAKVGSFDILAEVTWDVLVGGDAPPLIESPLRVGAGARFAVGDKYSAAAMIEGSFGRAPQLAPMLPLVPVEPLLGINLTIAQRPAPRSRVVSGTLDPIASDPPDNGGTEPPRAKFAGIQGVVRDANGNPIVGALVRVAGREILTKDDGAFVADSLTPGTIDIEISAQGYGPEKESLTLRADEVRAINPILRARDVGTLKGIVRAYDGSPISSAAVVIQPGNYTTTTDGDGAFVVKVPAGDYTATASAAGFQEKSSTGSVKVPGPILILNIELPKKSP